MVDDNAIPGISGDVSRVQVAEIDMLQVHVQIDVSNIVGYN